MAKSVVLSALALLLLLGLFHFPVPVYRDHTALHFPVWEVAAKAGGAFFPLSNAFLNHGAPLASDPNNLLLYPTAWLLKILSAQQAYSLHFFGHALLSFWLMAFLLMERLERKKALILGAFWVFSGPFLAAAASLNLFTTFCWVPGIFLAARRGSIPGQVLTFSMAALGAEPVIGLAAGILVFCYAKDWKRTALAAAITGALYIPLFLFLHRAFAFSTKLAGGLTHRTALQASLQPARLLETIFPFAFGVPGTKAPWVSFSDPVRWLLPTLAIAWLFFFLFERNKKNLILIAALLFFALGSFNPVVRFAYEKIPSLALIRFPEKLYLMAAFLLMWQMKERTLNPRRLRWLGLLVVPAFLMSPVAGLLAALSYAVLMLWAHGLPKWALAAGLVSGLVMGFYTVPLSSDLYAFQEPERKLMKELKGQTVLDQRDPLKIPDEARRRYREDRRIFGLRFEPPLKEAYYLRRRLLLAPTGMGFGISYAFSGNISGAGPIYYDMVTELAPTIIDRLAPIYRIDVILKDFDKDLSLTESNKENSLDRMTYLFPTVVEYPTQFEFYCGKTHCVQSVSEMMNTLGLGAFDYSKEVLISGPCEDKTFACSNHITVHSTSLNLIDFDISKDAMLILRQSYSPIKIVFIDGNETHPKIAFGAILAIPIFTGKDLREYVSQQGGVRINNIPAEHHIVRFEEPLSFSLIIFLVLFYAMLLTVFILWSLKSLSRRTTKKSA